MIYVYFCVKIRIYNNYHILTIQNYEKSFDFSITNFSDFFMLQ